MVSDRARLKHERTLLRLGGVASIVAALWLPLFVVLFFGVLPALGLDASRFGDPDHVLSFFAAQPALIRLAGLVNVAGITTAGFFALILARQLPAGRAGIGALGWGILRQVDWPRGLGFLGLFGAAVGTAMFVLEYVFVTQTGDAGGGVAQAFMALFIAIGLVITLWHAWGGIRLLRAVSVT